MGKKTKLYNVKKEEEKRIIKVAIFDFIFSMFVFAIILLMASTLFNNFYVDGIWYAFLAAIFISFLNSSLRPILTVLTLPITVLSLGILYPIVNVIILKIVSLILGSHFVVEGIFVPFFVAIFISVAKLIADAVIVEPIIGRKGLK